jgi:hypothetical protein
LIPYIVSTFADKVFEHMTGLSSSLLFSGVEQRSKRANGWAISPLPLAIEKTRELMGQVETVSNDVSSKYGNTNPFASFHVLAHYMSLYLSSFGSREDPVVIWCTEPCNQHKKKGEARLFHYDNAIGHLAAHGNGETEEGGANIITTTVVWKRDEFASCIFTVTQLKASLVKLLRSELAKKGIETSATFPMPTPCDRAHFIPVLRAYILHFCSAPKTNMDLLQRETSNFTKALWPFHCRGKNSLKTIKKQLGVRDIDFVHVGQMTKEELYATCAVVQKCALSPTIRRSIFQLAISKMKPLCELTEVSTIFSAMEAPCRFYTALGEIQEKACSDNNTQLAVLILASFGIFSEGLKTHIELRRHLLTEGIKCSWKSGTPERVKLTEMVTQYSSTTSSQHLNGFDFQQASPLKETPQV